LNHDSKRFHFEVIYPATIEYLLYAYETFDFKVANLLISTRMMIKFLSRVAKTTPVHSMIVHITDDTVVRVVYHS